MTNEEKVIWEKLQNDALTNTDLDECCRSLFHTDKISKEFVARVVEEWVRKEHAKMG